ncbi:hypothetical protein E4U14_007410 [Claviceps sp. LM454 group G7]|nr:hypothetical protein E4U14_007410 [Claviceps sp. LM454 group G7]
MAFEEGRLGLETPIALSYSTYPYIVRTLWLIALRQQRGARSDNNIAAVPTELFDEWNLEDKVGCLKSPPQIANASNNDVCTKVLNQTLESAYREKGAVDRRPRFTAISRSSWPGVGV